MALLRFLWLCGKPPIEDHGGALFCASRAPGQGHTAAAVVDGGCTGR